MSDTRLAYFPIPPVDDALEATYTPTSPALLVSFFYLDGWTKHRDKYIYRDWALDSGAFSAFNSGAIIDLDEYIETCLQLMEEDTTLAEIFSLDVIGDHKATLKNTEKMWKAGVPAIPTYHIGEPASYLKHLKKNYDKIAIGGVARRKGGVKTKFAEQVFSRVWPMKIHGFGYGSEKHIMGLPFHSTDATNWELGPCGFGRWNAFGNLSIRGSKQNLRAEVEWFMKLEQRAKRKWKKEMLLLDQKTKHSMVRLAVQPAAGSTRHEALIKAKKKLTRRKTK